MTEIWVNPIYVLDGEEIELDRDTYHSLNKLAVSFYQEMGYEPRDDYKLLSCSQHPTEQLCFSLALKAYKFHSDYGLD